MDELDADGQSDGSKKVSGSHDNKQKLVAELVKLKKKYAKEGMDDADIRKTFLQHVRQPYKNRSRKLKTWILSHKLLSVSILIVIAAATWTVVTDDRSLEDMWNDILDTPCLIENNMVLTEASRPIMNCEVCKDLKSVQEIRNMTPQEFAEEFAYTGVPVLVKDATQNWTAMQYFNYSYFKDLYTSTEESLKQVEEECQFFGYNTEFGTLEEAFEMSDDRAAFKPGEKPWYFGWSNCNYEIGQKLRQHYQRPYFLPNDSESSTLDWIFMGGQGPGAFLHLDFVSRPSWQAQIMGTKTWFLVPVPECENVCHSMNVTVHKGDIIVLDTNQWYHSTLIHPGEISITIGSEYD